MQWRKAFIGLCCLLWASCAQAAQPIIPNMVHSVYYSTHMGGVDIGYEIYIPTDYINNPTKRYPVVYMLHDQPCVGGEDCFLPAYNNNPVFQDLDTAINSSLVRPMIMVAPNGGQNSPYMDAISGASALGSSMQYSIINELIPYIDAHYRTVANKTGRSIQGMGYGGQGCLLLAFAHSDMFGSSYCFAPTTSDNGSNIASNAPTFLADMFNGNTTAFQNATAWALANTNASTIAAANNSIHITVGNNDTLYTSSTCSPSSIPGLTGPRSGSCSTDMITLMANLGITHDPLQVVTGCAHDFNCLLAGVKNANFVFADGNFPNTVAPVVQLLAPYAGSTAGGDVIQIFGGNFIGVTSVTIGSFSVPFTVVDTFTINATVPAGTGTVQVVVTTRAGASISLDANVNKFTYVTLAAVDPESSYVPCGTAAPSGGAVSCTFTKTFNDDFRTLTNISNVGGFYSPHQNFTPGIDWYQGEGCCMGANNPGINNGQMYATNIWQCTPTVDGSLGVKNPSDTSSLQYTHPTYYPWALDPAGGMDLSLTLYSYLSTPVNSPTPAGTINASACAWTSAVPRTVGADGLGFAQQYGYFESRVKYSNDSFGIFPSALWMLPQSCIGGGTCVPGEVDLMEHTSQVGNYPPPTRYCWTVHDYIQAGGHSQGYSNCPVIPDVTNYHTWGMVWTNTKMDFFFDGIYEGGGPSIEGYNQPYYLLYDLGIGGGWPTTNTISPTIANHTHIRAYQSTPPPGTAASPQWDGTIWNNAATTNYYGPLFGTMNHGTFFGTNVTTGYSIYLPPGYNSNCSKRYPVIYHIGGSGGDENSDTDAQGQANGFIPDEFIHGGGTPFIQVYFNGGREGHYRDAWPGPGAAPAYPWWSVQSMFVNNLIPFIDANYCTNPTQSQRAIQGGSMGGQACALYYAMYYTLWTAAWCVAPATDDNSANIQTNEPKTYSQIFNNNPTAFDVGSVWQQMQTNASQIIAQATPFHLIVGSLDSLYAGTHCSPAAFQPFPLPGGLSLPGSGYTGSCAVDLLQLMTNLGIAHDPIEVIAGCTHDWVCIHNATGYENYTWITQQFAPVVTSVSPAAGAPAGGTSVTIRGKKFTGVTAVNFGSTPAASFTLTNDTTITAISPAGTGTVDVTVVASGTSATSTADRFLYNVWRFDRWHDHDRW
jgi:enterochelin esterase-like enzyme